MTDYLLFRLYGPLAAWGDTAVGEYRPTYSHPSKSAILGLVAAALGIRRDEEEQQLALANGYGFAVRVEAAGHLLSDFHSYSRPKPKKNSKPKKKPKPKDDEADDSLAKYATRRDELRSGDFETKLSTREYRCDALYTVCLWQRESAPHALSEIKEKLRFPEFTLYLGRKSCPLALPVEAQIIGAENIKAALMQWQSAKDDPIQKFEKEVGLDKLLSDKSSVYWEEPAQSGLRCLKSVQRRDVPLSRRRWQFTMREEFSADISQADLSAQFDLWS